VSNQTLYRFYDSENSLLYIGISINAYARAKTHQNTKEWWPEVAFIKLECFDSREFVQEAEKLAIQIEKPKYNIQHQAKHLADPWVIVEENSSNLTSSEIAKCIQSAFVMFNQLKRVKQA
jgi:predicted GIY-YIG superfamily endonuclease